MPTGIGATVIVASYNSAGTIRACLDALQQQTVARSDYQIVVVDSSQDGTDEIVRREYPSVRLDHSLERLYYGAARNRGLADADGALVIFVDSDCVVAGDWLEQHARAHARYPDAGVVGGSLQNGNPRSLWGWSIFLIEFASYLPAGAARPAGELTTANTSYKRWVFERHGVFPCGSYPGEDKHFHANLASKGVGMVFAPEARAAHRNREKPAQVLGHLYWLGQGVARVRLARRSAMPWLMLLSPALAPARFARLLLRTGRASLGFFARACVSGGLILAGYISLGLGEMNFAWREQWAPRAGG